eukprot:1499776-Rhodomonas_salina.2
MPAAEAARARQARSQPRQHHHQGLSSPRRRRAQDPAGHLQPGEQRAQVHIARHGHGLRGAEGQPDRALCRRHRLRGARRAPDESWRPFTQVDMSATRQHGGAGLGLSIVKEVVEAHDGAVCMESHTEGAARGSCFRCSFPVRQPDMELEAARSGEGAEAEAGLAQEVPGLSVERERHLSVISHADTALSDCEAATQLTARQFSSLTRNALLVGAYDDASISLGANKA